MLMVMYIRRIVLTTVSLLAVSLSCGLQAYTEDELAELTELIVKAKDSTVVLPATSGLSAPAMNTSSTSSTGQLMTELAMARMEVKEQITPETTALFGDKVDLNSGSVSFRHVDISLKGSSQLPVEIARTYRGSKGNFSNNLSFGDWLLEIPSITTTTLEYTRKLPTKPKVLSHLPNCGELPPRYIDTGFATVDASRYWSGDTLDIPGVFTQKLRQTLDDEQAEGYGPRAADNWKVECLTDRYGFKATSPEGTVYTFDVVVLVPSSQIYVEQESDVFLPEYDASVRMQLYTLNVQVSRVEDRFGNWVSYSYQAAALPDNVPANFINYSNKLVKIESNDGRVIDITYESGTSSERIKSIKADNKTWLYTYDTVSDPVEGFDKDSLTEVTRPDAKKWLFNLNYDRSGGFHAGSAPNDCQPLSTTTTVSTIEHPEGAVFKLTQAPRQFGRSKVPANTGVLMEVGRCFSNISITKKELAFNQQTLTWDYSYSQNAGSPKRTTGSTPAAAALSALPVTIDGIDLMDLRSTAVNNPDGSKTVHVFNRSYSALEGKEVLTLYYDTNASSLLKSVHSTFTIRPKIGVVRFESCKPGQYPVIERQDCIDMGFMIFDNEASHNNHVYPHVVTTKLHNASTSTDFVTTYTEYDDYGNPLRTKETGVGGSRFKKNSYLHNTSLWVLNLPTKTELSSDGQSWTTVSETSYHGVDDTGKLLPFKEKQFGALVKENTYHPDGNLKRQTYNPSSRWIEFSEYQRGIPKKIELPGRYVASTTLTASQEVNSKGEISSVTNFRGHKTSYSYDVMGRVEKITPPSPWAATEITYTNSGELFVQTVNRGAYKKRIEMDALFRPVLTHEQDTVNSEHIYVVQTFDAYNQPVFTSVPSHSSTESKGWVVEYDGLQRLKRQYENVNDTGTSYRYLDGNKIEVVDALGNTTTTSYRSFGAPEQKLPLQIEQPEDVTTVLAYNLFDNVTSITQDKAVESRIYNAQQRLCRIVRPDVGATAYAYDDGGNVIWEAQGASGANSACSTASVLATQKTSFTYDNIGNIHKITFPDSSGNITHTYDAQGNLTELKSGTTSWEYEYTSQGKVEKETLLVDNLAFMLDPGYNELEHLTSLSYPSGNSVTFTVDAMGRTLNTGSYATQGLYHPNGQLKSFSYGNGVSFSQSLDDQNRPKLRKASKGSVLLSQDYSYDDNNNIESITDAVNATNSVTEMTYDGLDRLKTAKGFWGTGEFEYDTLGNISRKVLGTQVIDYHYNTKNQLSSVTGGLSRSFSYDGRGNVTSNGVHSFGFNRANRLVTSGAISYVYDGHGLRIVKNKGGNKTYSLYNRQGQLMSTFENNGYTDYFYLGNQLVAKQADPQTVSDKPGYTGHVEDKDLALTYMQQRYYDPAIGRFYSNDPVGFNNVHNFNRYAYANNNPYKYIDPDGKNALTAFGGLIHETGQFLQGNGFDGGMVMGALADGYNGEGAGFWAAAGEDLLSFGGGIVGAAAKLGSFGKKSFDLASTFRGGKFKEVTLQPGTKLERAFEAGVTNPVGGFTTRGVTAQKLTSGQGASDVLALGGTSNAVPTHVSTLIVTQQATAKIGFVAGSSKKSAVQVVVDNAQKTLKEVSRREINQ